MPDNCFYSVLSQLRFCTSAGTWSRTGLDLFKAIIRHCIHVLMDSEESLSGLVFLLPSYSRSALTMPLRGDSEQEQLLTISKLGKSERRMTASVRK